MTELARLRHLRDLVLELDDAGEGPAVITLLKGLANEALELSR